MLRFVRHSFRIMIRLAALLVLLGLGTVPVECAAVYGPHSIFVSAEAVAQVQNGGPHHVHGDVMAASGKATMAMPVKNSAAHEPVSPATGSTQADATTSLPAPAVTSVDALIAVVVFETDDAPGPSDFAPVSTFILPLADLLLPPPEPPPPQLGS